MQLDLDTHLSLDAVRQFLDSTPLGAALVPDRKQAYAHIGRVLRRMRRITRAEIPTLLSGRIGAWTVRKIARSTQRGLAARR